MVTVGPFPRFATFVGDAGAGVAVAERPVLGRVWQIPLWIGSCQSPMAASTQNPAIAQFHTQLHPFLGWMAATQMAM